VLDACVLHSAPVRDVLLQLATARLYRPRWTGAILEEFVRSVLSRRPDLERGRLERTVRKMNGSILDSIIDGYEHLVEALELPDTDDRHVLAAAIHGGAGTIVTFDLKDFPDANLAPHRVVATHPDDFGCELFDRDPAEATRAAQAIRGRLQRPPKSWADYLSTLEDSRMPRFASRLREGPVRVASGSASFQGFLPEDLEEVKISSLFDGEVVYVVPWAILADEAGMLWIRGVYTFSREPHGTSHVQIVRSDRYILVTRSTLGEHRYERGPVDPAWLPIPARFV